MRTIPTTIPVSLPATIVLATIERYCGVDHRAISACMPGRNTPSPSPDKTRSVISRTMWILAAVGVSRDTTDDRSTLPPNNHLPPKRSAAQPPGTYKQTLNRVVNRSIAVVCMLSPGSAINPFNGSPELELLCAYSIEHFCLLTLLIINSINVGLIKTFVRLNWNRKSTPICVTVHAT